MNPLLRALVLVCLLGYVASPRAAEPGEWLALSGTPKLDAFQKLGKWFVTDRVELDAKNPKRLTATPGEPGAPILVNGIDGRTNDLLTKQSFTDVEIEFDFMVSKNSNSGVKMHGVYEIQIRDTADEKTLTGDSCGGIYPKAELTPRYHHIDKGVAPLKNVCKAAGEWQHLRVQFRGPRFDAEGKKISNAQFVRVEMNGELIHDKVEVETPTGHNYVKKEVGKGPILLQGDHGPVAFRNVRVRELK